MTPETIPDQPATIRTDSTPLVTRWGTDEDPVYLLEFEDAGVSVRLTEAQTRGLSSRILSSMLMSDDDLERITDDDPA